MNPRLKYKLEKYLILAKKIKNEEGTTGIEASEKAVAEIRKEERK